MNKEGECGMAPGITKRIIKTIVHPASFHDYQNAIVALIDLMESISVTEEQELHGYVDYLTSERKWRPTVVVRVIS